MKGLSLVDGMKVLGNTEEEVKTKLLFLGCKGRRGDIEACPIAVFIAQHCSTWPGAMICRSGVDFNDSQICNFGFPDHVTKFIDNFDKGEYEGLISPWTYKELVLETRKMIISMADAQGDRIEQLREEYLYNLNKRTQ